MKRVGNMAVRHREVRCDSKSSRKEDSIIRTIDTTIATIGTIINITATRIKDMINMNRSMSGNSSHIMTILDQGNG